MATAARTRSKSTNGRSTGTDLVDSELVSDFDDQLATLRADILDLTSTVKAMATDTGEKVQTKAAEAAREGEAKLRETSEKARKQAQIAGDDAYSAGREAAAQVQANVVQNPLAALALAAGIGFLAGAMAKR